MQDALLTMNVYRMSLVILSMASSFMPVPGGLMSNKPPATAAYAVASHRITFSGHRSRFDVPQSLLM
jgi:hypothetical protein